MVRSYGKKIVRKKVHTDVNNDIRVNKHVK